MLDKKKPRHVKPQTLADVSESEHHISELLAERRNIRLTMLKQIEALNADAAKKIEPLEKRISRFSGGISAFAHRHKAMLTAGGRRKTVDVPGGGQFRWRKTPPKVVLDAEEEEIIKRIEEHGLMEFITYSPKINRSAMIEHPRKAKRIPGVDITQEEKFIIQPKGAPERVERVLRTREWKITLPRS